MFWRGTVVLATGFPEKMEGIFYQILKNMLTVLIFCIYLIRSDMIIPIYIDVLSNFNRHNFSFLSKQIEQR